MIKNNTKKEINNCRKRKMNILLEKITKKQINNNLPNLSPGDNVKIYIKIQEGNKFRIQIFSGIIIKLQGQNISKSITVQKISNNIAIEKNFPIHSPIIEKIEITKFGKVRRAKIYFLRNLRGKTIKIKENIKKTINSNN